MCTENLIPFGQKIRTIDKDGELSVLGVASPGAAGYDFFGKQLRSGVEVVGRKHASAILLAELKVLAWYSLSPGMFSERGQRTPGWVPVNKVKLKARSL